MKNKLENIFPRNPTQTRLRRFQKVPWGEWNTDFDKVQRSMKKLSKNVLKDDIGKLR